MECAQCVQALPMHHLLDPMHCEKNVCKNLLRTFLGEKHKPQVRLDLEARRLWRHLWLQPVGNTG